ncbi:hypothetical protein EVAR_21050_1 [Eumeta japonica]|uniref:Uncharacterized protein n=1 Tax=Eumeta variegata TaxID=151549 RepID=A0A4C1V166_EUMVA|nr:hypothetical protein EVAR_21050_1 [Eumeta japonica]
MSEREAVSNQMDLAKISVKGIFPIKSGCICSRLVRAKPVERIFTDIRGPFREVASTLPVSRIGIGYLMEWRLMKRKKEMEEKGPTELSLTERKLLPHVRILVKKRLARSHDPVFGADDYFA